MSISQNVQFWGGGLREDPEDPPGEALMHDLRRVFTDHDWNCDQVELWRDCGWQFSCSRERRRFDCSLAYLGSEREGWMIQLTGSERDEAAPLVAHFLQTVGVEQRWRSDGFPTSDDPPFPTTSR